MRTHDTAQSFTEELSASQEAAVLFAAGFGDAARRVLEARISRREVPPERQAWLMLLEIHHLDGQRDQFDALLERYREIFGNSACPAWGYPNPIQASGTLALKGRISPASEHLAEILTHARSRKTVAVDMGEVQRIEYGIIGAFTLLLRQLQAAGKRVILANVNEINATFLETAGANSHAVLMRRKALEQLPDLAAAA